MYKIDARICQERTGCSQDIYLKVLLDGERSTSDILGVAGKFQKS